MAGCTPFVTDCTTPKAIISNQSGAFSPETPRRSPRLAARIIDSGRSGTSLVLTPTREALRKLAQQRKGIASLFHDIQEFVRSHFKILETSVVTAEESNKLHRYLIVTRKPKVFDDVVGPHDAVRLLVEENGHYRLLLYEKTEAEGTVQPPFTLSSIPVLHQLDDAQWVICPGVKLYSSFQATIGYDIKRVVKTNWPPDTARDCQCNVWHRKSHSKKTCMCDKCSLLQLHLSARKREHDRYTPAQRKQRQQASSTVSFDLLSPASKKARLSNMRKEIAKLRSTCQHSVEKMERVCMSDSQNEELCELVQAISSSDEGQQQLQTIFQEADTVGSGKGDVLKSIWEQDTADMKEFYEDQHKNGKFIPQYAKLHI